MKITVKNLLLIALGTSLFTLSVGLILINTVRVTTANQQEQTKAKITCKDFLQEFGDKPKELEFLECKNTESFSLDALEASYRVSGKDAAKIERFLQQRFKMSKLKFLCCIWEPVPVTENGVESSRTGSYKDQHGYYYDIVMHSPETLINERQDWQKIPFFYVRVTAFLEDF